MAMLDDMANAPCSTETANAQQCTRQRARTGHNRARQFGIFME
jgi:hypothetical protein